MVSNFSIRNGLALVVTSQLALLFLLVSSEPSGAQVSHSPVYNLNAPSALDASVSARYHIYLPCKVQKPPCH